MRGVTRAAPGAGTCKLDEPRAVLPLQVTSDLFLMHNIYCNLLETQKLVYIGGFTNDQLPVVYLVGTRTVLTNNGLYFTNV